LIFLSILAVSTFVSVTEAPLVGRPREHFYNAVGEQVRVELHANPTDVRVEDSLTLTIQINGAVNPDQVERPDLRALEEFASRFHIDDLDEASAKETPTGVRLFRYRLRPKNEHLRAIPPLLFRYYDAKLDYFPTTISNSIPLHVRPRIVAESTGMPMQEPIFLFHIAEGPALLTRQLPRSGWPEMLLAFFSPALMCAVWFGWWRYRHPDEAKLAHLRRSRSVRHALDELRRLSKHASPSQADDVASIFRLYLQQRLDLPQHAGTPAEVANYLNGRGYPTANVERVVALLEQCDAARFGPLDRAKLDMCRLAEACIVAVEAEIASHDGRSRTVNPLSSSTVGLLFCLTLGVTTSVLASEYVSEENDLDVAAFFFQKGVAERDNDLQARTDFRFSARMYAKLRQRGIDSVELHLNEGNARLLSGDLPGAIVAFHRGLRLDPDDVQLRQALAYARSRVEFATPEDRAALSPREESLHWAKYPLRRWGIWLIAVLSAAGWIAIVRWRVTREAMWVWAGATVLLLAVLIIAARVEEFRVRHAEARVPFAVVRQANMLRKGDGPSFALRRDTPLPAGVEVTIRQERGDWLQVELADGSLGWLPREVVERE
jgi:hypothetical protein